MRFVLWRCISRCPDQTPGSRPDFDLSAVNWMCPICGLAAFYHRGSLKVFDETDSQGRPIPMRRSFVVREWVGQGFEKTLYTHDLGPFETYEEASQRAKVNPRWFPQMREEVDNH